MMSTLFRASLSTNIINHSGTTLPIRLMSASKLKPRNRLYSYLLDHYAKFIQECEKKFPAAVKVYRGFKLGVKELKNDFTFFFQTYKKVNMHSIKSLTRKELEIYWKMPKDLILIAPVLAIMALPFGGLVLPIVYTFPKKLLTSHFWSLQQRSEFAMLDHKKRLLFYRPVFRCLQSRLRSIKNQPLHKPMSAILGLLGSGRHPSPASILQCKQLFSQQPYQLSSLYQTHVSSLLRIHNMHRGWRRRKRLRDRATWIHYMDMAIIKEGGIQKMTQEELRSACFIRGLNPTNMRTEDMTEWLDNWLCVSRQTDTESASLLLHCPLFFGYNQPSNWALLHDRRNVT